MHRFWLVPARTKVHVEDSEGVRSKVTILTMNAHAFADEINRLESYYFGPLSCAAAETKYVKCGLEFTGYEGVAVVPVGGGRVLRM